MGIDLWLRTNISAPRPPILKVKVLNFPSIWGCVLMQKNLNFRFNRTRKSGKTEFFEEHIKRTVITHLITVLFATFDVCRKALTGLIQIKVHGRAILKKAV